MKRCYIVGAGSLYEGDLPFERTPQDLVIAADGGYVYLQQAGIAPDLLIGDFDSMPKPQTQCQTITLPVEKDETDVAVGLQEGLARGYQEFVIYGGLGGKRLSHTLANLQHLATLASHGAHGELVGGGTRIMFAEQTTLEFSSHQTGNLSLFAYSPTAVVTIAGMKYELTRGELTNRFPLGVSNQFLGQKATVTVHSGQVLAVVESE